MKIRTVVGNNRKKVFEVRTSNRTMAFPYAKVDPPPTAENPLERVHVDQELNREGFTYVLKSGREGTVHLEQVLEYNQDPGYLRDALLYRLTIEAQKRAQASPLSKREIIRRLGTSATQFYRLLDQTNYRKTIDQRLSLLHVLDCDQDAAQPRPSETILCPLIVRLFPQSLYSDTIPMPRRLIRYTALQRVTPSTGDRYVPSAD